jgi:hypothetical protein
MTAEGAGNKLEGKTPIRDKSSHKITKIAGTINPLTQLFLERFSGFRFLGRCGKAVLEDKLVLGKLPFTSFKGLLIEIPFTSWQPVQQTVDRLNHLLLEQR